MVSATLVRQSLRHCRHGSLICRSLSTSTQPDSKPASPPPVNFIYSDRVSINNQSYTKDDWTNVTDRIVAQVGRNLHLQKYHPLSLIRERIVDFFYKNFHGRSKRTPLFSVFDNLHPVVSVEQNFDSLLGKVEYIVLM